jgi:Fe-S-cluster containining protein
MPDEPIQPEASINSSSLNPSSGDSPLGLAHEVERLMKMPQSLCKQRGICCRVATFRGSLNIEDIIELGKGDSIESEMARDFASLFIPYPSQEAVRELAPVFVDRVRQKASEKNQDPDRISFFHCKYVLDDGRCGVHEDRPTGCRTYPFPHENTIYHPGCGFEKTGQDNWQRIKTILDALGLTAELQVKEDHT